jgi:hypothetical protein
MQDFVGRHGLTFPNLRDDSGNIFVRFGVFGQPAWAFVDADGNLETVFGALSEDDLTARLAALAA